MTATARNPFETGAAEYDGWYDSAFGAAVLRAEVACLEPLVPRSGAPSLEVGVGTGRFADALGVTVGLDPSAEMLALAAARQVEAVRGVAEALPFRDGVFQASMFVTTLEFVADVASTLREATRVTRPDGVVVIGFIPASGAWAAQYREQAASGESVFASAHFFDLDELRQVAGEAGFVDRATRSALLDGPDLTPRDEVAEGFVPDAGFAAVAFERRG